MHHVELSLHLSVFETRWCLSSVQHVMSWTVKTSVDLGTATVFFVTADVMATVLLLSIFVSSVRSHVSLRQESSQVYRSARGTVSKMCVRLHPRLLSG